jgi:hypothetical protein
MTKRYLLIALFLILGVAAYVWFFVYNKAHQDFSSLKPAFEGSAIELLDLNDENLIDRAVLIEGEVSESEGRTSILDQAVQIRFTDEDLRLEVGDYVKVQCRMVGMEEDLLTGEMLILCDQCVTK